VSPIIADVRDGGRQVCVMMLAGVRNAMEPGILERQGGRAGAGVTPIGDKERNTLSQTPGVPAQTYAVQTYLEC
jgi:hypothetical protein